MVGRRIYVLIVVVVVSLGGAVQAPRIGSLQAADTPQSAALKGMGAYLRGAGSYNLNTAKADSINTDTVVRWKQDLRKIAVERRADKERQQGAKRQHLDEVKRRLAAQEYELRVNPTPADIQNGHALNALLYDLMDPDISSGDWYTKTVQLPKGMSVKDLIFRFTPASASTNASKVLSRGVIALSRLDIKGENWPTAMKDSGLEKERIAYETAYAKLRDELIEDKFDVKTLLTIDRSLEALKSKVQTAVPKERGFRDEAVKFVAELNDATRMFDAVTVDYAREILIDTKNQEATTVAELVSFMLKYRLQFASAERSASGRVLYGQIYEAMQKQTNEFGIKPPAPADAPVKNDVASKFQAKSIWEGDKGGILAVTQREGETFRATIRSADGSREVAVTGTVKGSQLSWLAKDSRVVKKGNLGAPIRDHFGTITTDGDKIDIVWRDPNGKSGSSAYHRRKGK